MNLEEIKVCNKLLQQYSDDIIEKVKTFTELEVVINEIMKKTDKNKKVSEIEGGKRQFRDIMQAAREASCVEEFKLYLSYKKSKGIKIWTKLAHPLNCIIDELAKTAALIVKEAEAKYKKPGIKLKQKEVHLEILKKYTGYLMWQAHVFFQ